MKTIIIDIAPPGLSHEELDNRMDELESLVSTYGGVTIVRRVQKRHTPDYRTYIGSGKLDELIILSDELGADLIIIGNIMKPAQVWNVNEYIRKKQSKIQAWDRVDLILKIFALHAVSPESKLQIELASVKHMGPRIYGMGMELSRQGGGSKNAKGQGETNTEIMKRHLREKERSIHEKLEIYARTRALHREHRKQNHLPTVGIVGYTNAGKSSLFNLLTKKGVLAENKLFATLGTSVGKVWLQKLNTENTHEGGEILLNDTIGFIRDLPPDLIAAFGSTLEDSIQSDVLLFVVDASDRYIDEKLEVVEMTLSAIGAVQERIMVFNKTDAVTPEMQENLYKKYHHLHPIYISTYNHTGIGDLLGALEGHFLPH